MLSGAPISPLNSANSEDTGDASDICNHICPSNSSSDEDYETQCQGGRGDKRKAARAFRTALMSRPVPRLFGPVTKVLEHKEIRNDPKAREAILAEGRALVDEGMWLESTVINKADLVANARKEGKKIHMGDLLTLCSIKYAECDPEMWKHKGRICFRGDNVRDELGAMAVFQQLSASPTTVHTANSTVAYGSLPGHSCEAADAIRAYIQSLLKSKVETWVGIPPDLWPAHWKGKYTRPMCKLVRALYGHPESGSHSEQHLKEAVVAIGGEPIENHPSSFWFPDHLLSLTVYDDDLLLAGPTGNHLKVWKPLMARIALEQPEPLNRFIGRTHLFETNGK